MADGLHTKQVLAQKLRAISMRAVIACNAKEEFAPTCEDPAFLCLTSRVDPLIERQVVINGPEVSLILGRPEVEA